MPLSFFVLAQTQKQDCTSGRDVEEDEPVAETLLLVLEVVVVAVVCGAGNIEDCDDRDTRVRVGWHVNAANIA